MPRQDGIAIEAHGLSIRYRRYFRKNLTLKDSVMNLFRGNRFEEYWALRGLSFTVAKGTRLGVIGRNGAGKSTLLRAIAGVLTPGEGTIRTYGRISPLLELGAGFRDELTGRENVFFNGAIMGLSRRDMSTRFDRIVEFADIGDFIDAPLSTYSSGMKARLGFAVATDIDPEILLLDEVLSVGDQNFRSKANDRMGEFFKQGKTVVLVSHSMEQIKKLCDDVIYIDQGQVVSRGDPEDVICKYIENA